jgi:hypothetical protein
MGLGPAALNGKASKEDAWLTVSIPRLDCGDSSAVDETQPYLFHLQSCAIQASSRISYRLSQGNVYAY